MALLRQLREALTRLLITGTPLCRLPNSDLGAVEDTALGLADNGSGPSCQLGLTLFTRV